MYSVCIYIYTLLKVVGYYDLSVLSMSVTGSQNKIWVGCVTFVGHVSSILFYLGFFELIKLCKAHKPTTLCGVLISVLSLASICVGLYPEVDFRHLTNVFNHCRRARQEYETSDFVPTTWWHCPTVRRFSCNIPYST